MTLRKGVIASPSNSIHLHPVATISVASIIATVDLCNSFSDGWERLKTYAERKISTHVNVNHLINFLLKGMHLTSLLA
jgi:hypothetical protein